MAEPEEWREIPGHPGYEASSFGRVRSTDRQVIDKNGRRMLLRGKILKPAAGGTSPYLRVSPNPTVRHCSHLVHVLVCTAFHGPKPSPKHEVAHWNNDCLNNRPSNLRWTTSKDNKADMIRHGTKRVGSKINFTKLTEMEVLAIRRLRASGLTLRTVGERFGISETHVRRIAIGERWGHLPYVS
jgi:hypothetical protein